MVTDFLTFIFFVVLLRFSKKILNCLAVTNATKTDLYSKKLKYKVE